MNKEKIPFWRDGRVLGIAGQVLVVLILLIILGVLGNNLIRNYQQQGLKFGFEFLSRPASFDIGNAPIFFSSTDSFLKALLVGLLNTGRVTIFGIILATGLGITVGIARLSDNWLVRFLATVYVETFRNTPLLLQLFCWYFAFFLQLPSIENPVVIPGPIFLTNRGLDISWPAGTTQTWLALAWVVLSVIFAVILWGRRIKGIVENSESGQLFQWIIIALAFTTIIALVFGLDWRVPQLEEEVIQGGINLSTEFATLLVGLTVYTAAFIAEVVRAGIQSVNKGQWEAGRSLGLNYSNLMQLVIFPQALRVMIPPLTSEFLNLTKNSSLAIATGYSDVYAVSQTTLTQTGRDIEMVLLVMTTYLTINMITSLGMNWLNRSVQIKER